MTDQFLPAGRFAERDFSAGDVFNRTVSIFSRNLLPFGIVSAIAYFPSALALSSEKTAALAASGNGGWIALGFIATLVLNVLSQAIVLYGAFEDMRGLPVNLGESIKVGLRRFFPVLGVAICMPLLAGLAAILLLFPGLMVMTMLFVSVPACVVERLGPFKSMGRSAWLTKGHRWKIFGIWIAVLFVGGTAQSILNGVARAAGGVVIGLVVSVLCGAILGAFNAILAVVAYHDLRVAKEGVDTDQIAAVFD
jgi:hypothetical protein